MKSHLRLGELIVTRGFLALLLGTVSVDCYAEQSAGQRTGATFLVFFHEGDDKVEKRFDEDIKKAVCQIALEPEAQVVIYGFADRRGSKRENQLLSERRAISVANSMARYGMSCAKPAEIRGFGERGGDGGDQPFSRRVEILIRAPSVSGEAAEKCLADLKSGELPDPPCRLKPP